MSLDVFSTLSTKILSKLLFSTSFCTEVHPSPFPPVVCKLPVGFLSSVLCLFAPLFLLRLCRAAASVAASPPRLLRCGRRGGGDPSEPACLAARYPSPFSSTIEQAQLLKPSEPSVLPFLFHVAGFFPQPPPPLHQLLPVPSFPCVSPISPYFPLLPQVTSSQWQFAQVSVFKSNVESRRRASAARPAPSRHKGGLPLPPQHPRQ